MPMTRPEDNFGLYHPERVAILGSLESSFV